MVDPIRVDRHQPPRDGRERGAIGTRRAGGVRHDPRRGWHRRPGRAAPADRDRVRRAVEDPEAGGGIAAGQSIDEARDRRGIRQAEEVSDHGLIDLGRSRGDELIQDRLRIAHAAGRQARHEAQRIVGRGPALGLQDAGELALDLRDGQTADVVALQARQDGRREPGRLGRGEHEDDERGRLLERLEQRVPGVLRDLVRLVEDVDLAAQMAGRIGQAIAQLADLVDAAVGGGIDLEDVERRALADGDAGIAGVTRIAVAQVGAVHGLGQDPRERGLARPARARRTGRRATPVRCGRRCAASRRPLPGPRSGRRSALASGDREPGGAPTRSRPAPVLGARSW